MQISRLRVLYEGVSGSREQRPRQDHKVTLEEARLDTYPFGAFEPFFVPSLTVGRLGGLAVGLGSDVDAVLDFEAEGSRMVKYEAIASVVVV